MRPGGAACLSPAARQSCRPLRLRGFRHKAPGCLASPFPAGEIADNIVAQRPWRCSSLVTVGNGWQRVADTAQLAGQLVEILLGHGPIQSPDSNAAKLRRFEISCIDAHPVPAFGHDRLPVGDAAAGIAPDELDCPAPPRVGRRGVRLRRYRDLRLPEVCPQRPVATTNRAITGRQRLRFARNRHRYRAAVTGHFEHVCTECDDRR